MDYSMQAYGKDERAAAGISPAKSRPTAYSAAAAGHPLLPVLTEIRDAIRANTEILALSVSTMPFAFQTHVLTMRNAGNPC
jgi:hypothetical protein